MCGLLITRSSIIVRERPTALLQHVEFGALVELSVEFLWSLVRSCCGAFVELNAKQSFCGAECGAFVELKTSRSHLPV